MVLCVNQGTWTQAQNAKGARVYIELSLSLTSYTYGGLCCWALAREQRAALRQLGV